LAEKGGGNIEVLKEYWGKVKEFWKSNDESLRFLVVLILAIYTWNWMQGWWVINVEDINAYLNVKIPSSIVGCVAIPVLVWGFDLITPGSHIRKSSEDPVASAILLGSLAIALGIMLSK
jgi:hypothetical protein